VNRKPNSVDCFISLAYILRFPTSRFIGFVYNHWQPINNISVDRYLSILYMYTIQIEDRRKIGKVLWSKCNWNNQNILVRFYGVNTTEASKIYYMLRHFGYLVYALWFSCTRITFLFTIGFPIFRHRGYMMIFMWRKALCIRHYASTYFLLLDAMLYRWRIYIFGAEINL
jgi:hypothetical protein